MTISELIKHFNIFPSEVILALYGYGARKEAQTILTVTDTEDEVICKMFLRTLGKFKVDEWKVTNKETGGVSLLIYLNKPARRWGKKYSKIGEVVEDENGNQWTIIGKF